MRKLPSLLAAFTLSCIPACLGATPGETEDFGTRDDPAYALCGTIWTSRDIPVCWENPQAGSAAQRAAVTQAVASTWSAAADVRFVGWGTCTPQSKGIRILIDNDPDTTPHTKGLGSKLNGVPEGMVLNFERPGCPPEYTKVGGEPSYQCIRISTVHEFGHALGFSHEQNRPDTPGWCTEDQEDDTPGDMMIGSWDTASVMNYCNPVWDGGGQLSPGDIQAARTIYGAPTGGKSVTRSGWVASCPLKASDSWTITGEKPR